MTGRAVQVRWFTKHRTGFQLRSGGTQDQAPCCPLPSSQLLQPFFASLPSAQVLLPPAWRLACARRVDFLFGSLNLALKYEYVLEVQEKGLSTGGTIPRIRKHVEFLFRTHPNKIALPSSENPPLRGLLTPSLHQPAKSLLEVPYPVSLPRIGVVIWLLYIDLLLEGTVKAGRCNVKLDDIKVADTRSAWRLEADNRQK